MKLSIIVPALNEGAIIVDALSALTPLRRRGVEVIVADGGSGDDTRERAAALCDRVVISPRGRARQMNAGAAAANGDVLLFLHADTKLPDGAEEMIIAGIANGTHVWGRFDVRIVGKHPLLPMVAAMMNLRSRATGVATGDQAMFMTREAFQHIGGFPDLALMEDIELSKRLKRLSSPLCLSARARTSGRRWDERGLWRTIFLMWRLRLSYFVGASPEKLARIYGHGKN